MPAPTTYFSYGSFETTDEIICTKVMMQRSYATFNISASFVVTRTSSAFLKASVDTMIEEFRKENQAIEIIVDGSAFFDGDPDDATAMIIRGDCSVVFNGAVSAKVECTLNGKLRPENQLTAGFYQFTTNFTISQSERVTGTITGTYSATAGRTAYENFMNAATGATARAAAILTVYYPTHNWDLITIGHSYPDESNDWLQFTLTYAQRIFPKFITDLGAGTHYDFSQITFSQTRSVFGDNAFPNSDAGSIHGVNWAEEGDELPAHARTSEGGLGVSYEEDVPVRYSISGWIPVKSSLKNYADLMVEWETLIKPALTEMIYTYIILTAENAGKTDAAFIETSNVPFNMTENGISPNMQIVVPGGGGLLEFAEQVNYSFDPNYLLEYYVNKKDDLSAWIGKLPTKVTCMQSARVSHVKGTYRTPKAPPFPKDFSKGYVWIQAGPCKIDYTAKKYKTKFLAGDNTDISVQTITYSCPWALVNKKSLLIIG